MTQPALSEEFDRTLAELESLHREETLVLRTMNREALDQISADKDRLCSKLRELGAIVPLNERHREGLARLRKQATLNQLLVIHARDTIRTILSQATGASFEGLPGRKPGGQEGLRLNVRG